MNNVGQPVPHESARGHVTGEALYTDDLLGRFPQVLHAWPVVAPHAHARILSLDILPALADPGVVTILTAADVPGEGDSGPNRHDEPLFPKSRRGVRLNFCISGCRCSPPRRCGIGPH